MDINLRLQVSLKDNEPVCTSLDIARFFGKRHDHVLRDIDKLLKQEPELAKSNFGLSETTYATQGIKGNKKVRIYYMNKTGFTLLAFGFTGKKALNFKIAYIKAFEAMEQQLSKQQDLYQQYLSVSKQFNDGKTNASICGRGLYRWKISKRSLVSKLNVLEHTLQPALPF